MKRWIAMILCLSMCFLWGCASDDEVYVPTGDGLYVEEQTDSTEETVPQEIEQDLVLVYYPDVTMNPYTCTDYTNRTLFSLMYQSLFVVDNNYNVHPMLCRRYTVSDDMRTYNFYIDDANFSDGTKLTADDVLASLQHAMTQPFYKGRFQNVISISLNDTGGIRFYLKSAHENFPILMDIPIVKADEVESDHPLGTGPYTLEQTNSGARLRRVSTWWCDDADLLVTASAIPLVVAESPKQIRDAFEFSDVGLVCANPGSDNYVDYRCDYELWDCENGGFLYIVCNMESDIFSKPKVRAALTYAIDRDAIVSKYFRNFAHSATLPASPLSPYYNQKLAAQYYYDPDRFIQTLSDNYLIGAPLRILVNKSDTLRLRIAREIGKMMEECGLIVEITEVSGNDYYYYLGIGEFDIYVGQTRLSANMDLSAFFAPNGSLRYGNITDPGIYALCQETLANQGNYINLYQTLCEDGRLCPVLFQTYSIHATRGLLTGLTPSRDNVFFYTTARTMEDAKS